jgi:hypothetical protein
MSPKSAQYRIEQQIRKTKSMPKGKKIRATKELQNILKFLKYPTFPFEDSKP